MAEDASGQKDKQQEEEGLHSSPCESGGVNVGDVGLRYPSIQPITESSHLTNWRLLGYRERG